MRKLLVSVALATATIAAVPAAAQYHGGNQGWHQRGPARHAVANLLRQLDQVDMRIQRSARRGIISQREAFGLRRESNRIRMRLGYQGRDGLIGREFASLQVQVNRLEQRLRIERNDRDGRRF
ncbi:MAG TPA: hypothetical protein VGW40_12705 [Allosphingosinicella sp.]|nr:hypothetical protein [Allosphingosinicella sp.]